MTNRHLDPADLDALVLRALSSLPAYSPSSGFEDRVMAQVTLPRPAAVVLLQRAAGWVAQPRRVVALATAYAFSLVVIVGLAGPWVSAHAWLFGAAGSWTVAHASAWLDGALAAAAGWAVSSGLAASLRSIAGAGPKLWAGLATLAIAYAASGYGLHRLLKAPQRRDGPDAARAL